VMVTYVHKLCVCALTPPDQSDCSQIEGRSGCENVRGFVCDFVQRCLKMGSASNISE
jgi:hypothetical protein